jgi:predicted metal-dependent hydrolase
VAITPRDVHFEWDGVPMHYLPGEALVTHLFNAMHLTLPEGERAMAKGLSEALPLIKDERLREEVIGFIGQESMHASAHEGIHARLEELGLEIRPLVEKMEWLVDNFLGDNGLTGRAKHAWLCERLGLYAAMEHYTAVLGQWALDADHLEEMGMHPMMLDLIRWHGAEEVEHRNVAFDAYQYVDGSYARRVRTALLGSAALGALFVLPTGYLYAGDPSKDKGRFWPLQLGSAMARGVIPTGLHFLTEIPVYLKPSFHPSQMGSLDKALRYLAQSPGEAPSGGHRRLRRPREGRFARRRMARQHVPGLCVRRAVRAVLVLVREEPGLVARLRDAAGDPGLHP